MGKSEIWVIYPQSVWQVHDCPERFPGMLHCRMDNMGRVRSFLRDTRRGDRGLRDRGRNKEQK